MVEDKINELNHKKIVKTLKQGPDFGIYGNSKKYSDSIEKFYNKHRDRGVISIPYFAVTKKEKKMPENLFYEKLFGSVSELLKRTGSLEIEEHIVIFEKSPYLILGVDNGECLHYPSPISTELLFPQEYYSKRRDRLVQLVKTFSVGYDFNLSMVDIFKLSLEEEILERINKDRLEYQYDTLRNYEFIKKEVTKEFIKKICETIKKYGKDKRELR